MNNTEMKYEVKIVLRTHIIFAVHSSGNNSGFPVTSKIRRACVEALV
jgi:hypothetical protein